MSLIAIAAGYQRRGGENLQSANVILGRDLHSNVVDVWICFDLSRIEFNNRTEVLFLESSSQ